MLCESLLQRTIRWLCALLTTYLRAIVGTLSAAQCADIVGRKITLMICLVLSFVAITLEFVAVTIEVFFGGKVINGFATGALASVCTTYISEVAPLALRGLLTVSGPL
jgi:MFS transporter, SP family, general alpha glucoside:H+ symporter